MKKTTFWKSLFLLCALIVGSTSAWAEDITLAGWTFTDESYPANKTNFSATSGPCSGSTFYLNGSGSTWNNTKGYAFTSVTDITITLKLDRALPAGTKVSFSADTYYNKSSNAPMKGFTLTASENGGSYGTTGLDVTSFSLSTSSANKKCTYTTQNDLAKDATIAIKYTQTGSAGSGQGYFGNILITTPSSDPDVNVEDLDIACDDTYGEIPYTISNPDGSTLTAAEKGDGYDWIDNVAVDATNSKVTFTTTENDGAERSGIIVLTYGSVSKEVTVTQAVGVTKYTVTIEAPTNGTLVVKRGETAISSGAQIPDGTELTIETTPAENYRLRNWQAVDGSTHTYTATFTYTINASNVTIKANFELIPEHTASFYVNGTKVSEAVVKEDENIPFPEVSDIGNDKLAGWVTTEIEGYQAAAPTYKTTMGNADANYYAVFAHVVDALFDAADITYTPQGSGNTWTHTASGSVLSLSAGQRYTSGTPNTFTVTKGTSNYFQVNAPTNTYLSGIVVKVSGTDYLINSVQSGASLSTSGTTQTVSFTATNKSSMRCYATSGYQIRATEIYVTAKGYCTSIPTATISINEACTDGEGNYYGTYSKGTAFIVPADLTVSSVSVDDDGKLVVTPYNTGDIVKANTGVMVSSTSAGDKTVYLSSTNTEKAGNMLKGSGDAAVTAAAMATTAPNCKYYRLTMHNGTTIGFYWGAEDGASFAIAANKAYLAVPTALAAKMSGFAFDSTTTGINGVEEIAPVTKTRKVVKNGRLVIETANGEFTIDGARMK